MILKNIEFMANIYDKLDALLITNREGIIEYSTKFDTQDKSIKNEGYTGKSILEVYPSLTEETSSHFRVMRTGEPIVDERQTLTDLNGRAYTFLSSTHPIEYNNQIIGAIEGSVLLAIDGVPCKQEPFAQEDLSGKGLYNLDSIITRDSEMNLIKERIRKVAENDSAVMIIGETGTGKELIAQSLHTHSKRADKPFISQNCSAIPSNLLESLLFGTVKGSYTGAENQKGLLELAHQGTLFLDELNSMDISLQGKILKAIEEKKFRQIGSSKEKTVNVRIVSAMNEEPLKLIGRKELRSDLFYRLGVIQIGIPPLRKRRGDIPLLTDYFIQQFNHTSSRPISGVSDIVEKIFMNYDWPGNIRELRNAVEYASNFIAGSTITLNDIPEAILYSGKEAADSTWVSGVPNSPHVAENLSVSTSREPLSKMVAEYEKSLIQQALSSEGSVTNAARLLGTSRQALQYKVMKYRIDV
ncbi:AAA domain-containing protein [Aminipila butyrica]|uniref:AAA domain-containing protein n=1 Tax=Aminipila butyrica TaxID=433296 RepID=A0A858BPN3_9FIRM|nr:sigma 54-interacting transcriptional regulator [Aminipila butyrica]QIB67831.1 AAA domain-containing protein [Aminipila butyrica]